MSDYFIVTPQDFAFGPGEENALPLDCGRKLYDVSLRYETYGTLSEKHDNAILIMHALSGDAHVAGKHSPSDRKPGWWDQMVGPGKPIDTEKYFVICSNILGGCAGSTGPSSIDPATGEPYNLNFPVITISDMVRAQKRLMAHLKIEKFLSIIGASMGGMQALQWAYDYPDASASIIAIATAPEMSSQNIAFDWVAREAIKSDPHYNEGNYGTVPPENGLAIARMLAHITYLSDESMNRKFSRRLQDSEEYAYHFKYDFAVESYLEHQGQRFVERFDANSYLYITKAIDYFGLASKHNGDLTAAFARVKSPFLIVSISSDWLFPTAQSKAMVKALLANGVDVSFCELKSGYGHDSFLLETETLGRMVSDFLARQREAFTI